MYHLCILLLQKILVELLYKFKVDEDEVHIDLLLLVNIIKEKGFIYIYRSQFLI